MIDIVFAAAERLREHATQLRSVDVLVDLDALDKVPRTSPAAYVVPQVERAQPSQTYGPSTQRHDAAFSVFLVLRHADDAGGIKTAAALQALRDQVQAVLVPWMPAPECTALRFAVGELVGMSGGTAVWREEFAFERWVSRDAA